MAPVGRRLKIGDYVLLPKGSSAPPQDGIVYAIIKGTCQLDQMNKFHASVCKKKPGWTVQILTNDDTETILLDIPKNYPLIQYCTTELEQEIVDRPKEGLGMFVGKGLEDHDGNLFINYGQVTSLSVRGGETYCNVTFRKLPDGSSLTDMEFQCEEIMDLEVSILQYGLGLGVNVPFVSADRRIVTIRGDLENMNRSDGHERWIKEFGKIQAARPDQMILDQFLEHRELNLAKLLAGWDGLTEYIPVPPVKKQVVTKNLHVEFNSDTDGFGDCLTGDPSTPLNSGTMAAQNSRRQEFRSSSIPQVLPLPDHPQPLNFRGRDTVAPHDRVAIPRRDRSVEGRRRSQEGVEPQRPYHDGVDVQRQFQNLQVASGPYGSGSPHSSHGSSSQPSIYSKHSYHPTRAQLQKHKITFKDGAYGKSYTEEEATAGIEVVLMHEMMHSVKADEAYIRSYCIMMGDLTLVPWSAWRNASLLANNFEEHYLPVKWTKLPDLKSMDVTDLDHFWTLFYSMEEAAARYYVDSYCLLLGRVRTNLLGGFKIVGGRAGFMAMRAGARKNVIHVMVSYMRVIVNKFVVEVLSAQGEPVAWMNREATTTSILFDQNVRMQLTTLQFTELASRANGFGGNGNGHGNVNNNVNNNGNGNGGGKKEEWSSKMPDGLRATIPKHEGKNICLLSYTSQGCKKENDGCKFSHKKAGSPSCSPDLQAWIEKTYGSYVGP